MKKVIQTSYPFLEKAGLFIYLASDDIMVQKKAPGITLNDFLNKNRHNQKLRLTYDCADIYAKVVAQQDEIGYNHGDIRVQNIMVDPKTGAFNTLIDWDMARIRGVPMNEKKYTYDYRVGIFLGQCHRRGFMFSNPPPDPDDNSEEDN